MWIGVYHEESTSITRPWIFFLCIHFVKKMTPPVARSNPTALIPMYKYVIASADFLDCELLPCCLIAFVVLEPWSGVDGKIMLAIASIIGRSPGGSVLGSKIGFRNLSVVNDWRYFTGGIENLAIIFCADPFIIGFALADFIDLTITCASSP